MTKTTLIGGGIIVAILILCGAWYWLANKNTPAAIPASTPEAPATLADIISLASPLPNAPVSSPLTITGTARGNWYFEASFPVILTDWDGKIIAQGIAQAQSDWMTTDFVPFKATLTWNTADISGHYSDRGTLILKKDNPSGLPEHDAALEIPVILH